MIPPRYFIKEFGKPESPIVLTGIQDGIEKGWIDAKSLVRSEHQDFWYSPLELVGKEPTPGMRFACPQCKKMLLSRKIDMGNPIRCACGHEMIVPDPARRQASEMARTTALAGKGRMKFGIIVMVFGIVSSVASYMAGYHHFMLLYGPIGAGAVLTYSGWQMSRSRK